MVNNFADEVKEDDSLPFSNALLSNRYSENSYAYIPDKAESEKTRLLSCDKVRSIMEAYWDCTDVKFTADAVFAVAKLSCDFIDKAMTCAIKLSGSKNTDQNLTVDSLVSAFENDDRKHKRIQDVIRSYRRYRELLCAFDDGEYTKYQNRDATRN